MISPGQGAQLAQARPASTDAAVLYSAPARQVAEITRIVIANTTGSAVAASLFHDDSGGGAFDQSTALLYQIEVRANTTEVLCAESVGTGYFVSAGGQIGVQSGVASALTFSCYGHVSVRAPQ